MSTEPRITAQTMKVLFALLSGNSRELSGAEIAAETRLASGTLYPILLRLEDAGWLSSRWEEGDPSLLRRPRRRYYRVTARGAIAAKATADDMGESLGRLNWGNI